MPLVYILFSPGLNQSNNSFYQKFLQQKEICYNEFIDVTEQHKVPLP